MKFKRFRKCVAIDFDGVIHQHVSKWTVAHEIHDGPVPGAFDFIEQVLDEFDVVIFSARASDLRGKEAIETWLWEEWKRVKKNVNTLLRIKVTAQKPSAFIYIDDRGWHFQGTFPTMDELRSFEPWQKKLKQGDG